MSSQAGHLTLVESWGPPKKRGGGDHNRGRKFPPEPITNDEFAVLLKACVPQRAGRSYELTAMRLRCLLVVLFRTGLRIAEALALYEHDLNADRRSILVRHGKGDKQRLVLADEWAWREIEVWLVARQEIAPGAVFPVIRGPGAGRSMDSADVRRQFAALRVQAELRRRVHPHAFRHGFAVECSREGVPLYSLQGALGHARLDVTERYLRGIDPMERLAPIGARKPPKTTIPGASKAKPRNH